MAPIFSKAVPSPPRNSAEKIERWVTSSRPLLDSIFEILKDVGTMARMCKADAEGLFNSIRVKLDTACIGCVRLLESLSCLDLDRFAKGPKKPLTGTLPILFVLMLVVILYNAFVFGYMPAAGIALNSSTSLTFHAWIFLLLSSFTQAVNTDPGSTPMTPKWCNKDCPPPEAQERKRGSDEARWCRKSEAYKPDRAHYCRVLKKSVLRMDHYCPWLGNTVGFHNQKFFVLFLLYTNAACAQLGVSFIQLLVQYTLPALTTFCLISAEGLAALLSSLLIPFFLFHFWLIARNTTTIEFCEQMRSKGQESGETEAPLPNRYDLGIFQNLCSVLGSNPLLWLLPVGSPPGDGITFPINPEHLKAAGVATTMNDECDVELAGADAGPESTHPAASNSAVEDMSKDGVKKDSKEIECADEEGEQEIDEDEVDANEEGSECAASGTAQSENGDQGFLVWRDSAEFVEDLTIGCQFIGEKVEDCTQNSLLCLIAGCVPGAWGRKAARAMMRTRASSKQSLLGTEGVSKSGRHSARSDASVVRIVPVRDAGSPHSSQEDECDSYSSGSGGFFSN